jgi:EmrB/QacA subfamily drug resistance transporter
MKLADLSGKKFRWLALVVLAASLAIIIIDNSVLNVAIPYILRDLNTSLDSMQWVVSGYALIIATLLITMGRLGDLFGRKKIFIIGLVLFATGSFIASIATNIRILFLGEALIEAIGAAMMMTSSLSLISTEFQGRERAIAFGVWGSVAGAAASLGPLLGGYFTTYYSWRWSLRINVVVAIIAIIGSVFVKEAKSEEKKRFDWPGTFLSGTGLFSLVFGLIEGQKYGWLKPNEAFGLFGWSWPSTNFSIIPVAFILAIILLGLFLLWQNKLEKADRQPLIRLSMFKNIGFSIGLITIGIVSLGQFGIFFIAPIYLQNVLGRDAFHTGLLFLISSITAFIIGPITGFIASKFHPKWIVVSGMFILALATFLLRHAISTTATGWTLAPALIILGFGIGMASAQLTNIILSSIPNKLAGEASALNATVRQIGTSIGIAVIGMVLASGITSNVKINVQADTKIPNQIKNPIIQMTNSTSVENGQAKNIQVATPQITSQIKTDINNAIVDASKKSLLAAFFFVLAGALAALFLRPTHHEDHDFEPEKEKA